MARVINPVFAPRNQGGVTGFFQQLASDNTGMSLAQLLIEERRRKEALALQKEQLAIAERRVKVDEGNLQARREDAQKLVAERNKELLSSQAENTGKLFSDLADIDPQRQDDVIRGYLLMPAKAFKTRFGVEQEDFKNSLVRNEAGDFILTKDVSPAVAQTRANIETQELAQEVTRLQLEEAKAEIKRNESGAIRQMTSGPTRFIVDENPGGQAGRRALTVDEARSLYQGTAPTELYEKITLPTEMDNMVRDLVSFGAFETDTEARKYVTDMQVTIPHVMAELKLLGEEERIAAMAQLKVLRGLSIEEKWRELEQLFAQGDPGNFFKEGMTANAIAKARTESRDRAAAAAVAIGGTVLTNSFRGKGVKITPEGEVILGGTSWGWFSEDVGLRSSDMRARDVELFVNPFSADALSYAQSLGAPIPSTLEEARSLDHLDKVLDAMERSKGVRLESVNYDKIDSKGNKSTRKLSREQFLSLVHAERSKVLAPLEEVFRPQASRDVVSGSVAAGEVDLESIEDPELRAFMTGFAALQRASEKLDQQAAQLEEQLKTLPQEE